MKKKRFRKIIGIICFIVLMINAVTIIPKEDKQYFMVGSKVAKPIVVLEKAEPLECQIQENFFPMEYYFSINNYEEEKINEVNCEYRIELENDVTNFPVTYFLVDCDTNQKIKLIDGKSENLMLKKDVKESRKFKLVLQWQELSMELADEMQIKLKVDVVQKQGENV